MCSHGPRWVWRYRLWLWGVAWERASTLNDKHMRWGDNSWPCDDVGSYYCPYWGSVSWATWQSAKYAALLQRGQLHLTAPLVPITL
jgi:hypothetical protein